MSAHNRPGRAEILPIRVRLFANLADYLPGAGRGNGVPVDLPEGTTLLELTERLGIPAHLPRLSLVNGQEAGPDVRLRSGDVVSLLPPLVGG
jgi:molybdopterin converting factor small subunit